MVGFESSMFYTKFQGSRYLGGFTIYGMEPILDSEL